MPPCPVPPCPVPPCPHALQKSYFTTRDTITKLETELIEKVVAAMDGEGLRGELEAVRAELEAVRAEHAVDKEALSGFEKVYQAMSAKKRKKNKE